MMAGDCDGTECGRCKCLSCNPLCEPNANISSKSLQPGGKLYQLAVKENGPLEEGVVYTFRRFRGIIDLVFVFESTKNISVRAGGARGAAAPPNFGQVRFFGQQRKFGQSQL